MPDKSQNININYKFNTAEIDKLNASVARANQATNQLQQGAAKTGQGISTGFKQANQSILQMQNGLTRLKSLIEISSNPARTAKLSQEYKNLRAQLDAATKSAFGLDKALKNKGGTVDGLFQKFGNLYGAVQTVLGAAVLRQTLNLTLEMARLAGNTEGVERAFKRAFPNSIATLTKLRNATKGTVSDFELMQRTLQATNLGVSVEKLPELFEFAAARAQQTGESVDYLVDSIVRGIGRKSPLILDNLGISAIRLKEKFNGAALASQSVADVTKAVGEIAEEELKKMGGFAVTAATQVDQLTVAWERLRTTAAKGSEGITTGIVSFLTQSVDGWRQLITSNKELFLEQARLIASTDALRIVESKQYKEFGDNAQQKFDFLQQEINSRVQIIGQYNDTITKLKEERAVISNNNPYDKRLDVLTAQIRAYNDNKVVIASTILALKEYLKAIDLTNEAQKDSIVTIKTLRDELKALQDQREEATSIDNKPELDRLQREILLLEDRILKIDDNIKWQKQWDRSKEESALASMNAAEAEKELGDTLDSLRDKYKNLVVNFDAKDVSLKDSLEQLEKDLEEVLPVLGEDLSQGRQILVRLRLALKGEGADTSDLQKMINEEVINLRNVALESSLDFIHAEVDAEANALKQRLSQVQDFYSEQQLLAGDNERAKQQLRIKEERETTKLRNEIARKEKQAARTKVIIDTAVGIAKALATYPWPYALIPAAAVALQGGLQLAAINRTPQNFAEGVIDLKGPGTSKSDSIPANLSKGESVMTAWETRHANQVLKDVRAKKLDDRVLRDLRQGASREAVPVLNDERIIKAIKDQKPPDVVKIGSTLYDVRKQTDTYKKRIRNSSMSI